MAFATLGLLLLMRVPHGAGYVTNLLPALLLVGVSIGLCAPSVQIGALSGVEGRAVGLASGLVETMREIGGAVGIAAVSTVLVARSGHAGALGAFHSAFVVAVAMAALGALVAFVAFPRVARGVPVTVPLDGQEGSHEAKVVLEEEPQPA
jgi:hypothetical protein